MAKNAKSPWTTKASREAKAYAEKILKAGTTPGKRLPTMASVAVDSTTGKFYHGISRGGNKPTNIHPILDKRLSNVLTKEQRLGKSLAGWEGWNCAEFNAVNNAIHGGAKLENLTVHTVRVKTAANALPCGKCKITTGGVFKSSGQ